MAVQGRCLCKAVTISTEVEHNTLGACHCEMCLKWGSGPLFAVDCGTAVQIEGEEHVGVYSSSAWAERGFCQQCGSHLFYRLKESGHYSILLGVLDGIDDWQLSEQIFIDEKPDFYSLAEHTAMLTGEEVFAKHAGK